jgi:hypothetical protein
MLAGQLTAEMAVDKSADMYGEVVSESFRVLVQALGILSELGEEMDQSDRHLLNLCQSLPFQFQSWNWGQPTFFSQVND